MDSKCYFVKLVAQYSNKILNGYNCNLEELYSNIREANRFYILEQNIESCKLHGDIIDELNKFKRKLTTTLATYCRDCVDESSVEFSCSDIVMTVTNTYNSTTGYYTITGNITNATSPITYTWSYDPTYFNLISKNNNRIVLQPIESSGIYVYTNVGLFIKDNNDCSISKSTLISYHAGCTNPESPNYDSTAILDNGSCNPVL